MKSTKRKIPATMATQHPDHANKPNWHYQEFIETSYEFKEAYISFAELGATEYNWDWEGKLVDKSVIERLFSKYFDFFTKNQIGKDFFLTFRIPNPEWQSEFRLGRAFMGMLSASGLAREAGMQTSPLFEVILPMTENENQIISIQEAFREIATLEHRLFNLKEEPLKHIEVIPLFEEIRIIIDSANILRRYIKLHEEKFGFKPLYLRPYIARSDPALNAGLIPTMIAVKIALSEFKKFEKETKIKLYPMIGCGTLPFRGGLNPEQIDDFINEYKGISTTTIQSAFRYDFKEKTVKSAIKKLENELQRNKAREIKIEDEKILNKIALDFEKIYKSQIEKIAEQINRVAKEIPSRRERMQHVGLFGYSRGVGEVKLPRAIGFTASLYSLGVPPELISTGRGIKKIIKTGKIKLLEKVYINIKKNLLFASRFYNEENLTELIKINPEWTLIQEDVEAIEEYLGQKLGPKTKDEKKHKELTSRILKRMKIDEPFSDLIVEAAKIRKSIG